MRAHGVTNFPDQTGGGINLAGTGINPKSPAFGSARQACARFTPGAIRPPQATEAEFRAAIKFAKCMRTQGFPSFPDPTRTDGPPAPVLIVASGPVLSRQLELRPQHRGRKARGGSLP